MGHVIPLRPVVVDGTLREPVRCSQLCTRPQHSCGQARSISAIIPQRNAHTPLPAAPISEFSICHELQVYRWLWTESRIQVHTMKAL
jgi:hypothetical protein